MFGSSSYSSSISPQYEWQNGFALDDDSAAFVPFTSLQGCLLPLSFPLCIFLGNEWREMFGSSSYSSSISPEYE